MNQEIAIRKAELKIARERQTAENIKAVLSGASDLLKNPVLEIVAGYMILEWAQHYRLEGETYVPPQPGMQWNPATGFLGNLFDRGHSEPHYLIDNKAATVAEGGLLVAVALQQPGGKDLLAALVNAGATTVQAGLGLAGKAIPALGTLIK